MTLVLIFLSSTLLGLVLGTTLCIRYLRQELTARIGPTMDLVLLKLDNMQCAINLALANWQAELHKPPLNGCAPASREMKQNGVLQPPADEHS